jgi:hypothetical protein
VIAGSGGSVITEGRCGNAPRDGDLVGVPVSVVVADVVDGMLASVVGGVVVAVVADGAVGAVVTAVGVWLSWASWTRPQMITPIRTAITTAQPTNAIGLRQVGMASMTADGIREGPAHTAATHAATDQHSKIDTTATSQ